MAVQSSTRVKLLDETDIAQSSMPSVKCDVFKRLEENKTVLHLLCALNRAHELSDALHTLSKEQAVLALAQRDNHGRTPLFYTTCAATASVAIAAGASCNCTDTSNTHILYRMCETCSDSEVIALLLQANAAVNALNPQRRTALHVCSRSGKNAFIPVLCKAGAHTELRDDDGMTPLIAAVKEGATKCVMELVAAGASTVASYNGDLPLHLASKLGQPQIVMLLAHPETAPGLSSSAEVLRASRAKAKAGREEGGGKE